MLFVAAADDRAALHFDDVASALDAGLPLTALGGDPGLGERTLQALLAGRGVVLSSSEDAALAAAWRAGRASASLRARAEQRRQRAEFQRGLWAGLRYPAFVLVMACAVCLLLPALGHPWLSAVVVVSVAAVVAGVVWLVRSARQGGERWTQVPVLGPILMELGELPYLETLHDLYGAGVPLAQAHPVAVATVPMAALRQRLTIADRVLQSGERLDLALHRAVALHPETRSLLATGEAAGQLEDALRRALGRRREVTRRTLHQTSRLVGHAAYVAAAILVVYVVASFYLNHYAAILGHR